MISLIAIVACNPPVRLVWPRAQNKPKNFREPKLFFSVTKQKSCVNKTKILISIIIVVDHDTNSANGTVILLCHLNPIPAAGGNFKLQIFESE